MIGQSAFHVNSTSGEFVGIIAFDSTKMSAITAVQKAWGTSSAYKELTAEELRTLPASGLSVFTCTIE